MPCRSLLFLALSSLAFAAQADAPPAADTPEAAAAKAGVSIEDVRTFTAVYNLVKQAYVEDVGDKRLMEAAIKGLLSGLDPHSEYLDPRQLTDLTEDTSGAYDGLGLEVLTVDGVLRVIAPIDDTPAERGGIKPGDIITRIDGKSISSENVNASVELLRGNPGSSVVLTVLHDGESVPVDITLKREKIKVASVRARWLEPGYAYLRVAQFQEDTGGELKRKLAKLKGKEQAVRGVVLDLRSNPGGLLTAAVEVSDVFLDAGTIVTTRGRLNDTDLSFSATPGDLTGAAPLVILVDKGTASAAEIVAGALKDNHRGLILGQKTFGKGSVQTVLPLDDGHAVKLTTARYYTPSGVSIQATGIVPDIELRDLKLAVRDAPPSLITSERDLPNHLKGENEQPEAAAANTEAASLDDYALTEAVHVLKAMALRAVPKTGPAKG
ncbi:S41A family C-terminal processing peptidase-3 [Tahibacter aquaticus]|uniref:S41A family C-terminal processing peptidase-3 n=1 Tax=Tahibacter aquaticus TaxID=520092 RepID=A0A4V3DLU0_9GAMM|nr:S41 family peptidase [Tahibacter aquaticus]TDR41274.1 S41A family C-terminal processing peptidase-3 [Tahibacter aquaticus]